MRTNDLRAGLFEVQLDHRIGHLNSYIQAVQTGKYASLVVALWNLRALEDECRCAGHGELCRVCRQMEIELILEAGRVGDGLLSLRGELLEAAADIKQEAHGAHVDPEDSFVAQTSLVTARDTA